jgi:NAD(P)-dependent dehydrogenase (short-subunit alcohol dehydrogenase family)
MGISGIARARQTQIWEGKTVQDLSRHTAIITGASSGIGAQVARTFAAGGARLVLAARRADRLETLAHDLEASGGRIIIQSTDVTKEDDVTALFAVAEVFSPVTLLIANAGKVQVCPTTEMSLEQWRDVIDVNLTGAFLCGREALRVMRPRGFGRIINIGSLSAQMPRPDTISYVASKFGLEGITRSLALDGRPYGITASIIHPGPTISELTGREEISVAPSSDRLMDAEHVAEMIALMAAVPDTINLLSATMLPIATPYLGRG